MAEPIIKKIKINTDDGNGGESVNIGTSAQYVDYNNETVASALTSVNVQIQNLKTQLKNCENIIATMNDKYVTAKNVKQQISNMETEITNVPNLVSNQVYNRIKNTAFLVEHIKWKKVKNYIGLDEVLGNLLNLPLDSKNLRDWIEKISNIIKIIAMEEQGIHFNTKGYQFNQIEPTIITIQAQQWN